MRLCQIEGCSKKHKAYGYCSMHYRRLKTNGLSERPRDGRNCAVKDCSRKCTRNLYCDKHYYRFKRYGDPLIVKERYQIKKYSCHELFEKSYVINNESGCWEWIGNLNAWGYGRLNYKSQHFAAHRYSYEYFHGQIPDNIYVCHKCDNPKCVNPDHLFLGDAKSNMADKVRKGRHVGSRKLSADDVKEIRNLLYSNSATRRELSIRFDVGRTCIDDVFNRKTWRNISD